MATVSGWLLPWTARALGLLVSRFIGIFALDAFNEGKPFSQDLDWMLVISGPLLVVGALFLWSWFQRGKMESS